MAGSQAAWGIDVGITSLKAMRLRQDGDKVAVEAFEVIEHDKFLTEPGVDRDELIRHSVRKFLELNPIKGEMVYVGVPGSSTFARFVKLPPVDPKKIPEIVKFEAIQQIPFPLDQVNWDYQTFVSPESPDVEVGIFAMKKDLVSQVLTNFRASGVTVQGVQMSPLAVYNAAAFDGMTDGKGTVLIDMGAEHTDLVIMDQGRLWLRTINIGGNHFTDALAKSFKQSFTRAESLKKTAATSKYQKQIFQAMRPIFADLVAEIQRSIGHYNSSHRDSKLERIVGMGNPFKLPNLQKYLQQELKMEVIRLDNFRKVTADGKLAAGLNETILSMTASYGLGLQGLGLAPIDTNLLPVEIAREMMWRKKRPWFIGVAALFVLALAMWQVEYWLTVKAVASPAVQEEAEKDNTALGEATRNRQAWQGRGMTFILDKQKVDFFLQLANDRTIWPSISMDLLDSLPQAGAKQSGVPGGAPSGNAIVIRSITSEYSSKLSTGMAAGPGPMEEMGPGDNGMPPPRAMPGGAAPPARGRNGANGANGGEGAGGASGESDRGFFITITGYVASHKPDIAGYRVVQAYQVAMLNRATKEGKKPYYFAADGNYTGEDVPDAMMPAPGGGPGGSGNANSVMWGQNKGPFWDVFAPDVTGIKPEEKPSGPGAAESVALPPLGALDLFANRTPGGNPKMMYGDFVFTLKLKVFVKDAADKPAAGAFR